MESSHVCPGGEALIFACSGAADVGAVADRAAREMTKQKIGQMFCLAGVGGRIEPIINKTLAAKTILAIDGCPLNCAKCSLEHIGIKNIKHLQLADIGMTKGQTPPTEDNIEKAVQAGKERLV